MDKLGITFKINGMKDITEMTMEKNKMRLRSLWFLATKKPYTAWRNHTIQRSDTENHTHPVVSIQFKIDHHKKSKGFYGEINLLNAN